MSTVDTDKTVGSAVKALASALLGIGVTGANVKVVKWGSLYGYSVQLVLSTPSVALTVSQELPEGVTLRTCTCEGNPGTHVHFDVRL